MKHAITILGEQYLVSFQVLCITKSIVESESPCDAKWALESLLPVWRGKGIADRVI